MTFLYLHDHEKCVLIMKTSNILRLCLFQACCKKRK